MQPERPTELEIERERHRARHRERMQDYRAQQVRSAASSPEEVPAQVEEQYSHLPAEEKQEIAQRAMAEPTAPEPPAEHEQNEDSMPKKKPRPALSPEQKRRAAEILRQRLKDDPGVSCADAWRECTARDVSMAYSTFYRLFWRPEQRSRAQDAKPTAGIRSPAKSSALDTPQADASEGSSDQPARPSVAIESPNGRFSVEVLADGRRRIAMDMVVSESVGDEITQLMTNWWLSAGKRT